MIPDSKEMTIKLTIRIYEADLSIFNSRADKRGGGGSEWPESMAHLCACVRACVRASSRYNL